MKNAVTLIENDPYLLPFESVINGRIKNIADTRQKLLKTSPTLSDFAAGHEYFGLHFKNNHWVFREWAPNATAVFLLCDKNGWQIDNAFALEKNGITNVWEKSFRPDTLSHKDPYRLKICWPGGQGDRIPAYARRVVQDPETFIFNAQVWHPPDPYVWRHDVPEFSPGPLFIYEAHVGMAQEEGKVGTYQEFTHYILPRVARAGYNTLQLMAVQEHPYYGSFGYQVSSFFAPSSRFGTPYDLKELVDTAHGMGLRVIMDLVHSHSVKNDVEGLSRFDGTDYQYFHAGARGHHMAWDSRCFDYGKPEVLHFLLSNCRYWLDEFRFDGFRFDGITSMLYFHHGLGKPFTRYDDYFNHTVDEEALVYLALANTVVHDVRPDAVTIAEDISGMPGLASPIVAGGYGFDHRFAMGISDLWIKLIKEVPDEAWPMSHLWHELNNRRHDEKTISYAESHDQALVGDQSLFFRLTGAHVYHHMMIDDRHMAIDRAMALHKMIRMITLATAGDGYLNFMGNEFGHPEWIDFPREGNGWSYHYARRQWHLADDPKLKFGLLSDFDRDMLALAKQNGIPSRHGPRLCHLHDDDNVLAFLRAGLMFVFNFHPTRSYMDYHIETPPGKYRILMTSDDAAYGGHQRPTPDQVHFTLAKKNKAEKSTRHFLSLYLPTRTVVILTPIH